ncbi:hypothetical protein LXL04_008271 [Taraxacum kok-saghyz]
MLGRRKQEEVSPPHFVSSGRISLHLQLDLDSEDETLREDSEIALKQELAWAFHLSLQTCLLPTPKGRSCGSNDRSSLPSPNSLGRWIGEPVKSAILHTDSFLTNARGYPCLSKRHQNLLSSFFYYSVQIVLSGKAVHKVAAFGATQPNAQRKLPFYKPLMDNLEAQTYETFEKDSFKYIQYQRAVSKALLDRISDENASTTTIVLGKDLLLEHHYRYTSFIQPVTISKLYNDVKLHKDLLHFETAYVVKLHRLAKLSPSQSGLLRKLNKQEERMCKVRDLSSSMFFLQYLF